MNIPRYWHQARVQRRVGNRQVTVRRYGWSDESEGAARRHAEQRAGEAVARILAGEELPRREGVRQYIGVPGVPIREEILGRYGRCVVTRNQWGCHCLNSPDVLFVDVDFDLPEERLHGGCLRVLLGWVLIVAGLAAAARLGEPWLLGIPAAGGALLLATRWRERRWSKERAARREAAAAEAARAFDGRLAAFVRDHPDWHVRVYATPNGRRVLVPHALFAPGDPVVEEVFAALQADEVYRLLCRQQQCFRARLTGKPFRMGYPSLTTGARQWPVRPDQEAARRRWCEGYEVRHRAHAACRFLSAHGSRAVHPEALEVLQLHDARCGAHTDRPLA